MGGSYYKTTEDFDPNDFINYVFKWDSKFITIYANDIEIYKIDITPLSDFKDYYYFCSIMYILWIKVLILNDYAR